MSAWRRIGRVCAWVVSVLCGLWALLRLSGVDPPWPGSAMLAFTPWVTVPALVAVVLAAILRARWAAAVAAAAALVLVGVTAPRALGSPDRRDGVELRAMTVNLRVGGADAATIVRLVRDNRIDLLAVQEYTPGARDKLRAAGIDALLPYRLDDAEPLAVGAALFSRVSLENGHLSVAPGGFVEVTATLRLPGVGPVVVRSVHPCAPYTLAHQGCWRSGLDREPRATTAGAPSLLLGDFNATLDHPALRRLIGSGYRDAADAVGAVLAVSG